MSEGMEVQVARVGVASCRRKVEGPKCGMG